MTRLSIHEDRLGRHEADLKAAIRGKRFALVGAGQIAEMALGLWPARMRRPEFLLDSVKTGMLQGLEIRDLSRHQPEPGVVYLASAFKMMAPDITAIFARLRQPNILTVYDVLDDCIGETFANGWRHLDALPDVLEQVDALPRFYADPLSRRICTDVSAWRYQRHLAADYPIGREDAKYDLAMRGRSGTHYRCVYDCGSFDLSLTASLAGAGVTYDRLVAFEPDPVHFAVCAQQLALRGPAADGAIALHRSAVSDRAGVAPFLANGLFSARLVPAGLRQEGIVRVETCTLDAVDVAFAEEAQDGRVLIKLHVESAELQALHGAERLLRDQRCDLLINLSHDEVSFLEIPAYLARFGRYDLSLHSHALFGEGLTLFARCRD